MHEMMELKEMLCDELEKITKQGKITSGILDTVDKLTHSIKSIETIIAMDEGGYSNARGMSYEGSYADRRGRNMDGSYEGGSYRDSYDGSYGDGSYRMRRDGRRDQRYNYSREGYSRDLKRNLEDLMHEVGSEKEKRMIEKWMRQLDD